MAENVLLAQLIAIRQQAVAIVASADALVTVITGGEEPQEPEAPTGCPHPLDARGRQEAMGGAHKIEWCKRCGTDLSKPKEGEG